MLIRDPERRAVLKSDNRWLLYITIRPLANYLAIDVFAKTDITPTAITLASFMLTVIAGILFSLGGKLLLIIGGVLVFLSLVLDSVDGQLARYKNMVSKLGDYLDKMLDVVKQFILILGLCLGYYCSTSDFTIWGLGFGAFFAMFMGHYNARLFASIYPIEKVKMDEYSPAFAQKGIFGSLVRDPLLWLNFGFGEKMLYISLFSALNQVKLLMILSIILGFSRMIYDPISHIKRYNSIYLGNGK